MRSWYLVTFLAVCGICKHILVNASPSHPPYNGHPPHNRHQLPLQSITPNPTMLVCHSHTHHSADPSLRGLLIIRYGMEIVRSGWAGFFLFLWISTSVCRLAPLFFFSCIETYLQDQSTKGGRDWGEGRGREGGRRNWVLAHSIPFEPHSSPTWCFQNSLTLSMATYAPLHPLTQI